MNNTEHTGCSGQRQAIDSLLFTTLSIQWTLLYPSYLLLLLQRMWHQSAATKTPCPPDDPESLWLFEGKERPAIDLPSFKCCNTAPHPTPAVQMSVPDSSTKCTGRHAFNTGCNPLCHAFLLHYPLVGPWTKSRLNNECTDRNRQTMW